MERRKEKEERKKGNGEGKRKTKRRDKGRAINRYTRKIVKTVKRKLNFEIALQEVELFTITA